MSEKITGSVSSRATLSGSVNAVARLVGTIQIPSAAGAVLYDGPYEFTPTEETQIVEIESRMATQDITINPIPSNYGLITWNGVTLTVS